MRQDSGPFAKNESILLEIAGYTAQGSGVGHCRGQAVFVPGAAAGDKLRVQVLKPGRDFSYGKIMEILTPSPDRIQPDCPNFGRCGGCVFRHISYAAECTAKEQRVRDALQRIARLNPALVRPILAAQNPLRYRNKVQFPLALDTQGKLAVGFYAPRSHRLVACEGGDCPLQPAAFQQAVQALQDWHQQVGESVYEEATGQGRLRHLYLRQAMSSGDVMVCVVVNGNGLHREDLLLRLLRDRVDGLKSVVVNSNRARGNAVLGPRCRTLWGADALTDTLCGLQFSISPLSFYQVNREQAERLYALAGTLANLHGSETLLDLYCGTGTIGLSMASQAGQVMGVEVVPQAVEDARRNAARNGIQNARFFCEDADAAAARLAAEGLQPDVVILDPPRKGCAPAVVHTVAAMAPRRVVYVSCDPATLARDLAAFAQLGYTTREATPVDMFPRTAHVETVVLMSRVDK